MHPMRAVKGLFEEACFTLQEDNQVIVVLLGVVGLAEEVVYCDAFAFT